MCAQCHQWTGEFEEIPVAETPKTKLRWLTFVLDESGSMHSVRDDTEGGLRAFLDTQKEVDGNTLVTLVRFSNDVSTVYSRVLLADVPDHRMRPTARTALLDAIGSTIAQTQAAIIGLPLAEQPDEVVFVVLTDGRENESKDWNLQNVRDIVKEVRKLGWVVYFLGAEENAIQVATNMGMDPGTASSYASSNTGHTIAVAGTSVARGSQTGVHGFAHGERVSMTKKGDAQP
jgi:hypothetical protein